MNGQNLATTALLFINAAAVKPAPVFAQEVSTSESKQTLQEVKKEDTEKKAPEAPASLSVGLLGEISLRGFGASLESKFLQKWNLGYLYGGFPTISLPQSILNEISVGGGKITAVKFDYTRQDLHLNYFPFDNGWRSFYGGLGIEHRKSRLDTSFAVKKDDGSTENTSFDVTVNSYFAAPKIGWLHIFRSGFTLGTELSYRYLVTSSAELNESGTNAEALKSNVSYQTAKVTLKKGIEEYFGSSFNWSIFRFGWMF
jgi:hypothetical protein